MGLIFKRDALPPLYNVLGRLAGFTQDLRIEHQALTHLAKHRQLTPWAREAGGQLFGTIANDQICVVDAVGPHAGDERSRCRYRSNPAAAQRAILEQSQQGLLYLGEWHTHAEDIPNISTADDDAMRRLVDKSQLNSNSLLMLIAGRAKDVSGIAVWTVTKNSVLPWQLSVPKK